MPQNPKDPPRPPDIQSKARRKRDAPDPSLIITGTRRRIPRQKEAPRPLTEAPIPPPEAPKPPPEVQALKKMSKSRQEVKKQKELSPIEEEGSEGSIHHDDDNDDPTFDPTIDAPISPIDFDIDPVDISELLAAEEEQLRGSDPGNGSDTDATDTSSDRKTPVKKPRKLTRKGKAKDRDIEIDSIHFKIPARKADGRDYTKFLDIDYKGATQELVQKRIFQLIGCADVPEENLPELLYHFSKDKKTLQYEFDNWEYIQKEYKEEVRTKKEKATIEIILPANFLSNLAASLQAQKAAKKLANNEPVRNLFATDGSTLTDEATLSKARTGISKIPRSPSFLKWQQLLRKELGSCRDHPGGLCKIDKYNQHIIISDQLFFTWVSALDDPNRDPQVTVTRPPKTELFEAFHWDLRPNRPTLGARRDRRTGSAPPDYTQAPPPPPTVIVIDKKGDYRYSGHGSSPEPSERGHQKRHRSISPETDSSASLLTVVEWLQTLHDLPEGNAVNLASVQAKFNKPNVELLDLPVSYLRDLGPEEYKDINLSMKERVFIQKNLQNFFKRQRKQAKRH